MTRRTFRAFKCRQGVHRQPWPLAPCRDCRWQPEIGRMTDGLDFFGDVQQLMPDEPMVLFPSDPSAGQQALAYTKHTAIWAS